MRAPASSPPPAMSAPSPVALRAVSRFRGYLALLADLCVSEERVQRIRETTDEYEIEHNVCRQCHEYPAAISGRCLTCDAGRGRAA